MEYEKGKKVIQVLEIHNFCSSLLPPCVYFVFYASESVKFSEFTICHDLYKIHGWWHSYIYIACRGSGFNHSSSTHCYCLSIPHSHWLCKTDPAAIEI